MVDGLVIFILSIFAFGIIGQLICMIWFIKNFNKFWSKDSE